MHSAVATFTARVGPPRHVQPAGFRDFRGWLLRLNSAQSHSVWDELFRSISAAAGNDPHAIQLHKTDIVRSIVRMVVKPRADESSKLVSTNAGRQAGKPRGSGSTLMSVLDEQFKRWQRSHGMASSSTAHHTWPSSPPRASSTTTPPRATSPSYTRAFSPIGKRAKGGGSHGARSPPPTTDRLPSVQQLLHATGASHPHAPLPSFQELYDSIQRQNSPPKSHASSHSRKRHEYRRRT
ncbi:unnamed protein product [Agarophyton chilense]